MTETEEKLPEPIHKYGFDWSYGLAESSIELACFRQIGFVKDFDTGHTRTFHFERAMQLLWPETLPDGGRGYVMSKWSEKRVQSFVDPARQFQTWWGASTTGKSCDSAAIVLTYYLAAPECTAVTVCSTSRSQLMRRIWSEIIRLFNFYGPDGLPMEYYRGKPSLQYMAPGSRVPSEKAGVFGIPILRGTIEEAVGNIVGTHNDYNVLVIDEMQATRWAAVEAFDNLATGLEARFLGMGNPVSKLDPLGRASKPKRGWLSISPALDEWETDKGWCLYFDGLKSPGVTEPEKYPFLLTKAQIDDMRKDPGENTPRFWTQRRGYMPPEGLIQTVFTEALITKHELQRKVEWAEPPIVLAAMDESFTAGGDRCFLQFAEVGVTIYGDTVIQFMESQIINIEISDDTPIEYFIAQQVKGHCLNRMVAPTHFGLDVTAQQTALAAIFSKEWSPDIYRCQFGGAAVGEIVSKEDPRPPKEVYHNRVTQLWYDVRQFAISGQIAGLSDDACREACSRLVVQKNNKIAVESKEDMRHRTSQSPDIFDAHVILVAMAIERLQMRPGSMQLGTGEKGFTQAQLEANDVDEEERTYAKDDDFSEDASIE